MKEEKKSLKVQIWEAFEERGWVTPLSEPPDSFCEWWRNHDHCKQRMINNRGQRGWSSGVTAVKAWQIADYRDEFKVRGRENAAGTGVNYAYFGWWRSYPKPKEELSQVQLEHQAWCKSRNRPDPFKDEEEEVPEHIRNSRSFDDAKNVLLSVADKMDMNKAIGWTQADSDAANREKGEEPF